MPEGWSRRGLLAAASVLAAGRPRAQGRPVTLLVGYAPGGSSDVVARILAERLSATLGRSVVVENRAGAGGVIAAEALRRLPADGSALMLCDPSSHAIAPQLAQGAARYDPLVDFTPLGRIGSTPLVLTAGTREEAPGAAGLAARLKADPAAFAYASSGQGAITHLAAELWLARLGAAGVTHVPYRGGAPMAEALLKGETAFGFAVLASVAGQLRDGSLRALGLSTPQRLSAWPKVPTLAEAGVPDPGLATWHLLAAPAGVPPAEAERLAGALGLALGDAAARRRLADAGLEVAPTASAEDAAAFLRGEQPRFRDALRAAGL